MCVCVSTSEQAEKKEKAIQTAENGERGKNVGGRGKELVELAHPKKKESTHSLTDQCTVYTVYVC